MVHIWTAFTKSISYNSIYGTESLRNIERIMNTLEKKYCIEVGKAISALRNEYAKKSARLFAFENDIPKTTLWRTENGENEVQLITLKKIAEGFGWSMTELFKHIEERLPRDLKIFSEDHY